MAAPPAKHEPGGPVRPQRAAETGIQNRIYDDHEALSRAAAELVVACARRVVHGHRNFRVALSGGETPTRLFELLAAVPWRQAMPWRRVQVFWGDERCVPPADARSNAALARRCLLDRVPLAPERVYPMACHASPTQAARAYEHLIRRVFGDRKPRFDLVLLGLGRDGHTASLFPGSDLIDEAQRWVREVPRGPSGLARVSFTPLLINQAAVVAFLVSGAEKADAVRAVLQGPHEPQRLPAQAVRPLRGTTLWLLDHAAAAGLKDAAHKRRGGESWH